MKKKILVVFGTRPEAIKMAPVIKQLSLHGKQFTVKVCVTAQHRQMLDEVLKLFNIKPDYDLNIMQDAQDLFHITSTALTKMGKVLDNEKPDMVLVHGDTTTTFAAALAAFYTRIPVGHVEAGLRTCDKSQPSPKRRTGCCPTRSAPSISPRPLPLKGHCSRSIWIKRIFS
jgi:UDP-N-acetylglucosamine 2-epimerase (non-hydrolysing)